MLEQRIQQHFIDSADLKYQAAQTLSHPIAAAVQAVLACVTSGGKVLACGNGPSAAEAQQFAAFCVAGFERERPELAQALAVLGERPVTLARELTKQFEEVTTQPAQALTAWLDGSPQRSRGEFVVLLHPVPVVSDAGDSHRVLRLLLAELPLKTAVRLAAEITGASRNVLYDTALEWKREDGAQD